MMITAARLAPESTYHLKRVAAILNSGISNGRDMKLTQEILRELIDYNPKTGVITWRERDRKWFKTDRYWRNWNDKYRGKVAGSCKVDGGGKEYWTLFILNKQYRAHRIIWLYVYGEMPKDAIDHINHDGLDNSLENLRAVSGHENARNSKLKRTNKSGVPGIIFRQRYGVYEATIRGGGDRVYLGSTPDFFEACCMRKAAEIEFGFHENHGR